MYDKANQSQGLRFGRGYHYKILFEIEQFVSEIQETPLSEFAGGRSLYSGFETIRPLMLIDDFYDLLNEWLYRYSTGYYYSSRIKVFYDACQELGLISQAPFVFGDPLDIATANGMRYLDLFNLLVARIKVQCSSRAFTERERFRILNAKRNKRNVIAMEDEVFSEKVGRSRWLVLSLTLGFKSQYNRWVTIEDLQRYRERFFGARRYNDLFAPIQNFVWSIEHEEDGGLHLHAIIFYSADHNHDEYIAGLMGDYWVNEITKGRGEYWNSNAEVLKPGYLLYGHGIGVGQINWWDWEKREALRKNLLYLAKAEQDPLVRSIERLRTFHMGRMPIKFKSGRPRATR